MLNLAWYDWTLSTGRFDSLVEHGTTVWGTSATPIAQARFVYLKYQPSTTPPSRTRRSIRGSGSRRPIRARSIR